MESSSSALPPQQEERKENEEEMTLDEPDDRMLTIVFGKGNLPIVVPYKVAIQSKLVAAAMDQDGEATVVPLAEDMPNPPESRYIKMAFDYLQYHTDNPGEGKTIQKPIQSTDLSVLLCEWDFKHFKDLSSPEATDYIVAVNYLDIPALLPVTCAVLATHLKNKTPLEIRMGFPEKKKPQKQEEEEQA